MDVMERADPRHMNGHGTTIATVPGTTRGALAAPYQEKESIFKSHRFQESILEQQIVFEVLKMSASLYIWIGPSSKNTLENMCLAMPTRFSPLPLTSTWFGEPEIVSALSQKLSTKLKKPVVLSFNIQDHRAVAPIELALFNNIKNNADAYIDTPGA